MDVFPEEPPSSEYMAKPFLITPHTAGYSYDARAGGTLQVAHNFLNLLGISNETLAYSNPVFDHYSINYVKEESDNLKKGDIDFLKRRSHYPARGNFSEFVKDISEDNLQNIGQKDKLSQLKKISNSLTDYQKELLRLFGDGPL
jgi:hypothetical protein